MTALLAPEWAGFLLPLALAFPWLLLLAVPAAARAPVRALLPFAPLPALLAALLVPDGTHLSLPGMAAGAGFAMDATARAFLVPTALVWALAGWAAAALPPGHARSGPFRTLWLLTLAGNLAVVLAADLLSFYTGLAVMTFAAAGLVLFTRSSAALAAGRRYLAMMMAGEVALFVAVAALAAGAPSGVALTFEQVAASGSGVVLLLLGLAFGIKLGVLGLHAWLPPAHAAAPAPASAVLSGVIIKTGLLGWLRLAEPGPLPVPEFLPGALALLGLSATVYGVLRGLASSDPKRLLAWSSVSQMGLATILAGLALQPGGAPPAVLAAIAIFVLHHALSKAALFLGVGLLHGAAERPRRWIWGTLWLPALALAAAPGTSGALAKSAMDLAIAGTAPAPCLAPGLHVTGFVTMLLMLRLMWLTRPVATAAHAPHAGDAASWRGWPLVLLAVAALPWVVFADSAAAASSLRPAALGTAALPVLLALALAWWLRPETLHLPRRHLPVAGVVAGILARLPSPARLASWERHLRAWSMVGRLVVIVSAALALALWRPVAG